MFNPDVKARKIRYMRVKTEAAIKPPIPNNIAIVTTAYSGFVRISLTRSAFV